MSPLRFPWRFLIILLVTSLALGVTPARADGNAFVEITPPDTGKFPLITTYLDAFDDQGNFLNNLAAKDVTILENGQQITPDKLELLNPPVSFVLAINSDPALAMRDSLGVSRLDKLMAVLSSWSSVQPADSLDKLALAWNGGVVASRLTPADWKTRLATFDPSPRTSKSGLAALAYGLDAAQEAGSGAGVKKAILLISGHLSLKDQSGITDLINRAKQSKVRVFVWIVDSKDFQNNPGALVLQNLASATGGRYAAFTGNETLPNPEAWLANLRNNYRVTYSSLIRAGGQQSLSAQVNNGNSLALTSPAVNFALDIQAPSTALLSVPIQIVRQNPQTPFDIESFLPTHQEISMLVEFPDGRQRALKRTALYVDGQKVAENTSEPFTRFNWDLSGYKASADHALQVEVEDVLGLSQKSAEVPVQVTIVQPPGGMAGLIMRNRFAVTITFMILAGAVVLGIIFLGGRRGLTRLAARRKARAARLDPVTQPVEPKMEPPTATRPAAFPWMRRRAEPPPAYFVRLTRDGEPVRGEPIPLHGREITFGTDPTQATIVLDHPSLSPLQARLLHREDGAFILLDQNSTSGTWVNFEPIPQEGRVLKHGDMIHLGHLTYRFVMAKPPAPLKPTVTPFKNG